MHADLLLALCAVAGDRSADALERITRLLPEIEASGMSRLLLDYDALQPVITRCPAPFAQRLSAHPDWKTPASSAQPFNLSPQEMRVLKMLIADESIDDLARAMVLSVLTIRGHIRSIYKKLGVHSRAEAIKAAREAGIK